MIMETLSVQKSLNVLIAEDHELARYGLVLTLEEHPGVKVVAEAENGQQALELVETSQPNLVLMDIGMPVMDGITATQKLKKSHPEIKVVMLTSHQQPEEVMASLGAGADAYCMKDIRVDRLIQVMESVLDGALWLDPLIAKLVLNQLPIFEVRSAGAPGHPPTEPLPNVHASTAFLANPPAGDRSEETLHVQHRVRYNVHLTERELEVLQLVVEGLSNKEIAARLQVTAHTAKAHVSNIIQKLAVDDRTQAAVKAIQQGLVHSPEL